jgi:pyruvate dehydrogenase E2 component (dihydrolipoamide acetyltransferase)
MAYKLELPDIGEGVVEAEVQQWFVKEGDQVTEDQPLVEVMTDKATVTIPSPRRGKVTRLYCKVGDLAKVHAPLVELELDGGAPRAAPQAPDRAAVASATEAASVTSAPRAAPSPSAPTETATAVVGHKALATPAVRAMARELGLDVNQVAGSGPGGRVTKDDLQAHRNGRNGHAVLARGLGAPSPTSEAGRGPTPPGAPAVGAPMAERPAAPGGTEERVPLRGLRKRIAEHMARSKRTAAHFTFVEQADVTELVRVKDRMAEAAKAEGVRLTFLPFVVKAVVAALQKHSKLNAFLDEERQELVLLRRWDIGIAAATDAGLLVPVVRGADRRSLLDVAREIERLAGESRAGKARPEDLGRSTFTVTSLGALGGLFATPVLNFPEVGILGLHRIRPTPVVKDGQIVVRDVMHVSVTCDHRVVDGHEAAAFAYEVIRMLEDPNLLFMRLA